MNRRRNIIESSTPPSIDSLWLQKGSIKAFINGQWTSVGSNEMTEEEIQELKEKVDSLDKEVGQNQKDINIINSKITIELEIGNTTEIKTKNLNKLQNLQSVDHIFFADIDYGYGAAKWLPTIGGQAFIVTSEGIAVIYNIDKEGAVYKNSTDINLANPKTDLFEVVTQLPTENISTSKIYCVLSSIEGSENKYTEYAYIKQSDGTFNWEKMGEFKAEPDLSNYAKISDIGTPETLIFTLDNGSVVTKSIRVLSTTTETV